MSLSRNKELRIFEVLEDLTKHESFDSSASFVHRFVNSDLDLNNTHQSIPEENEELQMSPSADEKYASEGGDDYHEVDEEEEEDDIIVFDEDGVDTHSETGEGSHRQSEDDYEEVDDSRSVYSLSDEEDQENYDKRMMVPFKSTSKGKKGYKFLTEVTLYV